MTIIANTDHLPNPTSRPAKPRRQHIWTTDERGRDIVRVPVDETGLRHALVDADDFDRLQSTGLTGVFFVVNNGKGQLYVRTGCTDVSGGQVTVARAILGLGRGEVVRYRAGDRLDLRRCSIQSERGAAKRDDMGLALDRQDYVSWGQL